MFKNFPHSRQTDSVHIPEEDQFFSIKGVHCIFPAERARIMWFVVHHYSKKCKLKTISTARQMS